MSGPLADAPSTPLPRGEARVRETGDETIRFVQWDDAPVWSAGPPSRAEFELLFAKEDCARTVEMRVVGDPEWTHAYRKGTTSPSAEDSILALVPTRTLAYPRDQREPSFTFAARIGPRLGPQVDTIDVRVIDDCDRDSSRTPWPRFEDQQGHFHFRMTRIYALVLELPDALSWQRFRDDVPPSIIVSKLADAAALQEQVIAGHDPWCLEGGGKREDIVTVLPLSHGWYRRDDNPLGQEQILGREVPDGYQLPFALVSRDDGGCRVHSVYLWGTRAGRPEGVVEGPSSAVAFPCPAEDSIDPGPAPTG